MRSLRTAHGEARSFSAASRSVNQGSRCSFIAPLLAALYLLAPPTMAQSATDGESLVVRGERIRLFGIDAPELSQVCADGWRAGEESKRALARLIARARVDCQAITKDQYGRTVASCTANGEDIGRAMVRQGMAWAFTDLSWRYLWDDWVAWADRLGVHAHGCEKPWVVRERARGGTR
jgi:endonuclease YncB( thermonuclease family)